MTARQEALQRSIYDAHFADRGGFLAEQVAHPLFADFYDRLAALLLRQAPRWMEAGEDRPLQVLELGCGEGLLAAALHRVGEREGRALAYVGSDLSQSALELIAQVVPGAELVCGDAAAVARSQQGRRYDLVVAKNLLHHLAAPADVLASALPLLGPEGRVVAAEASRGSPQAWLFSVLAPSRERYFFTSRPARNVAAFRAAGLRLEAVTPFSWLPFELAFGVRFPQARRWLSTSDPIARARVSTLDLWLTDRAGLWASYLVWVGVPAPRSSRAISP